MTRRPLIAILLAAVTMFTLAACAQSDITSEITIVDDSGDAEESADAEPVIEEDPGPEYVSCLTGLEIEEEYAGLRPVAVMIPNDNYGALPHVGIGEAGVIYEILVEGSYTRLMAVFDAQAWMNLEKIGPVRSCRVYYCYYALEYDSIYVHYGQASTAVSFLSSGAIDRINGMTDSAFTRDSSRSSPNNAFTSASLLSSTIASKGFDTEYDSDYEGTFVFAEEEVVPTDGTGAYTVTPYYPIDNPWFEYNEEDGLYYRYEYGAAHVDSASGEQLTFKNILILSVPTYNTGDSKSHLELTVTGSGSGYYVTNGVAVSITWKKDSNTSVTHYYYEDGTEVEMNPGKTFICIQSSSAFSKVTFEGNPEAETEDSSDTE